MIGNDQYGRAGRRVAWRRVRRITAVIGVSIIVRIAVVVIAEVSIVPQIRIVEGAINAWVVAVKATTESAAAPEASAASESSAATSEATTAAEASTAAAHASTTTAHASTAAAHATTTSTMPAALCEPGKSQQHATNQNRQSSPHGNLTHQYIAHTSCARRPRRWCL